MKEVVVLRVIVIPCAKATVSADGFQAVFNLALNSTAKARTCQRHFVIDAILKIENRSLVIDLRLNQGKGL
jgi:hypothetical protein